MPTINENFLKLEKNYLFINIAKKVNAFMAENPDAPLIRICLLYTSPSPRD